MASRREHYRDFREHLKTLETRGKLVRIKRPINKDTELMPLVRWQFRGLEERERKAFMFENVTDAKGQRYTMPVTVGTLAATTEIYAIGMTCEPEEIHERWAQAQLHPIEPVKVNSAPAQEVVWQGHDLLGGHGLDMIPVPISTPGFDNAPYLTSANWITKDPESAEPHRRIFHGAAYGAALAQVQSQRQAARSVHRHRRHTEHCLCRHGKDSL
jgi:UbiD family decarboxylase